MQSVKVTTLGDIAERLGTSINTVSRALRDCSDIGAETKAKVKQVADEMGYRPNRMASFMRSKKSNIVAVVISSLRNPFFSISLDYLFTYFKNKQYNPLIFVKEDSGLTPDDIIHCIQSGACGVLTFVDLESETVDYCENNEIPLLLCGSKPLDDRVSAVYSDDYRCGKLVAQEAIASGSKRACYINVVDSALGDINSGRRNGFVKVLKLAGIPCDDIYYDASAKEDIESIKSKIRANGNDFIFCFNDEIATKMLTAFDSDKAFEDKIFGVDGISKYLPYSRKINSVGGNLEEIAKRCGHILINKIETDDKKIVREIFPTEIVKN